MQNAMICALAKRSYLQFVTCSSYSHRISNMGKCYLPSVFLVNNSRLSKSKLLRVLFLRRVGSTFVIERQQCVVRLSGYE